MKHLKATQTTMMTNKQYKTARKAIESDLEQAKRLGCTITCKKLRNALRRLGIKYLKPDVTGFDAIDITKNYCTTTKYI